MLMTLDTFYRSVLPDYTNVSTSERCTRFGVIDSALLCTFSGPVRFHARTFKTLLAVSEWSNLDDHLRMLHGMNCLQRKEDAKFEERPRSQRDKIPIDEGKPKMGQFDSSVSFVRQGQAEDWKRGI
jgi:hypothetical protein